MSVGGLIRAACLVSFCAASVAFGQASGAISVLVKDPTRAVLPGADVRLYNLATASERRASTDDAGRCTFAVVPPGVYRLDVTALGFENQVVDNIRVNITETTLVDISLRVGIARDTVTVTGDPALLQTNGPRLGRAVDARGVSELPLATRNFTQILSLSPGTATYLPDGTGVGRNTQAISVNGARVTQNSYEINGTGATLGTNAAILIAVPAPESIQEFKVQTSLYDAAYGHAGGGNIQVLTRGGTNEFHGGVYEYFRNNAFDANDSFLKAAAVPRPVLRRNVFGATLGGPIHRNRVFFFVSYQGSRETNGASLVNSISSNVLIAPGLTADRSQATLLATFHPTLPNGKPAPAIDPATLALLNAKLPDGSFLVPTPAANGRYTASHLSSFQEDQFNTDFDYALGRADSLSARFFFSNTSQFLALPSFRGTGANVPGFGSDAIFNNRIVSLRQVHAFSSRIANELGGGYSLNRNNAWEREPVTDAQFGIVRANAARYPGLPLIRIAQPAGGIVVGTGPQVTSLAAPSTTNVSDILTITHGRHTVRTGGEFRYNLINFSVPFSARGQIDFQDFNSFLVGIARTTTIGSGIVGRGWRAFDYNFFVQDDWQFSSRLSLNVGLRYELDLPTVDTRGRLATFDPSLYQPRLLVNASGLVGPPPLSGIVQAGNVSAPFVAPGVPRGEDSLLHTIDPHNIAPRFGFSRLVKRGLVVRGGYGLFYSRPSFQYASLAATLPPYYVLGIRNNNPPLTDPFLSVPDPAQFPTLVPGVALAGSAFDRDQRTPYFHQFNLTAQLQFAHDWLLETGYIGTRGRRLFRQIAINQARLASAQSPITNAVTGAIITTNTPNNVALRTPYQGVSINGFFLNRSDANSSYDSLQASLVRRFTRLQLLAAYTFAKSIDDSSGAGGGAGVSGVVNTGAVGDTGNVLGNQLARRDNRAVSDFSRKHRFIASYVWDLPAPMFDQHPAAHHVLAGWSTSGILTLMSGLPVDIVDTGSGSLYGLANGSTPLARPAFAPGASCATATQNIPAGYFFNPYAFRSPAVLPSAAIPSSGGLATASALGTDIGDVPRNCITGPSQANLDLSISRNFHLGEFGSLALRADFFNALNHPNLANPISNLNAVVSSGTLDSTGVIRDPGNFGRIVSTSNNPRIVQFSVHLHF